MRRVRTWESMTILEQARDNLGALAGLYRMHVSPDWPHIRVEAVLEAERRIRRYEAERAGRMVMYDQGRATASYRRRWRSRGLVVAIREEPFTRAVGEGEGGTW